MFDKIFIISANSKSLDAFCEMSIAAGLKLAGTASDVEETIAKVQYVETDLILINTPFPGELGDKLARDLTYIKNNAGLIVTVNEDKVPIFEKRLVNSCAFILPKPINRQSLLQAIGFMQKSLAILTIERNRSSQLEKKLDDLKIISRAKQVLIGNLHLTEQQAHRHIQKQSMDMGLSPREIAEGILKTYEF